MKRVTDTRLGIKLIEEVGRAGIKVLLVLYDYGPLSVTEILRYGLGHQAFYNALIKLKDYGLVEEERVGYVRRIKLTQLGREVAEYFKLADQKVAVYVQSKSKLQ